MRIFRHIKTDETVSQNSDGFWMLDRPQNWRDYVPFNYEYLISSSNWEEIIEIPKDLYPIGTKVKETATGHIWEKKETAPMWVSSEGEQTFDLREDMIGKDGGFEIVKESRPLFKTSDNVEIYEGDEVWMVNPTHFERPFKANGNQLNYVFKTYNHLKWFSTKEKAEEYILMHKSILTIKDVELALNNTKFGVSSLEFANKFSANIKEIVKSKLNG